jgi:hypothetical protein
MPHLQLQLHVDDAAPNSQRRTAFDAGSSSMSSSSTPASPASASNHTAFCCDSCTVLVSALAAMQQQLSEKDAKLCTVARECGNLQAQLQLYQQQVQEMHATAAQDQQQAYEAELQLQPADGEEVSADLPVELQPMAELQQEGSLSGLLELRMLPMAEQQAQTSLSAKLQQLQQPAQPTLQQPQPPAGQQLHQPAQAQLQPLQPAAQQQPQASLSPQLEPAKEEQQPQLPSAEQKALAGLALARQQLAALVKDKRPKMLDEPLPFQPLTPEEQQHLAPQDLPQAKEIEAMVSAARDAWSAAWAKRERLCREELANFKLGDKGALYVEHCVRSGSLSNDFWHYGCSPLLKAAQMEVDRMRYRITGLQSKHNKLTLAAKCAAFDQAQAAAAAEKAARKAAQGAAAAEKKKAAADERAKVAADRRAKVIAKRQQQQQQQQQQQKRP